MPSTVIEPLVGKSARQCSVTDHGNRPGITALAVFRLCHTDRRRDRRGAVPCAKGVMQALGSFGKSRNASRPSQGVKRLFSAREELMHIALMPHVKNHVILWRIKNPMDGKRQLHHTEI